MFLILFSFLFPALPISSLFPFLYFMVSTKCIHSYLSYSCPCLFTCLPCIWVVSYTKESIKQRGHSWFSGYFSINTTKIVKLITEMFNFGCRLGTSTLLKERKILDITLVISVSYFTLLCFLDNRMMWSSSKIFLDVQMLKVLHSCLEELWPLSPGEWCPIATVEDLS